TGPLHQLRWSPSPRGGGEKAIRPRARARRLTRLAAEGMERDAERRTFVRKNFDKYRFDEARRSARPLFASALVWRCSRLPRLTPPTGGPGSEPGPGQELLSSPVRSRPTSNVVDAVVEL